MAETITPSDAENKLEDLSGIALQPGQNPYDASIGACNGDNVAISLSWTWTPQCLQA